jgi:hypothetical protein
VKTKPGWLRRKWRRLRGRCPWCAEVLQHGVMAGGFLPRPAFYCPQRHYAEVDEFAGYDMYTHVLQDGGRPLS